MYNATQEFIDTILGSTRTFKAKLTHGSTVIEDFKSLEIVGGSTGQENFSIGSTVSQYITATVYNAPIVMENLEFLLEIGLLVDNSYVYIPCGYYTITKAKKNGSETEITGYDRMISRCSSLYSTNLTNTTIRAFFSDIGTKLGNTITFKLSDETILDQVITFELKGYTYRESIGYLCACIAANASFDRNGDLVIYQNGQGEKLEVTEYFEYTLSEEDTTINSFAVATGRESTSSDPDAETTEVKYETGTGFGISISNPIMDKTIFDTVASIIIGTTLRGGEVRFLGNILVDPWDYVEVTDSDLNTYNMPIFVYTHSFDGGLTTTIASNISTETENEVNYQGPISEELKRYYADLLLVKDVVADKVDTKYLNANYATIDEAKLMYADIDFANVTVADIDKALVNELFVHGGIITDDIHAATGTFTDYLTGVNIVGDLITAGTIKTERLIITGDSASGDKSVMYYINNNGLTEVDISSMTQEEQEKYLLNGKNIVANTITAKQIDVSDLFAQNIVATGSIKGAILESLNYEQNVSGCRFDLNDGSFYSKYFNWNSSGELTAENATLQGNITVYDTLYTSYVQGIKRISLAALNASTKSFDNVKEYSYNSDLDSVVTLTDPQLGQATVTLAPNGGCVSVNSTYLFTNKISASGSIYTKSGFSTDGNLVVKGVSCFSNKLILPNGSSIYVTLSDGKTKENVLHYDKNDEVARLFAFAKNKIFIGSATETAETHIRGKKVILHNNTSQVLYDGNAFCSGSSGVVSLGTSSYRFNDLYLKGNVYANGGSTALASDARIKTDIKDIEHSLELVKRTRPVLFKYLDGNSGREHAGMIAQEVEELMNEIGYLNNAIVCKIPNSNKELKECTTDEYTMALRYEEYIPHILKVLQLVLEKIGL